MRSSNSSSMDEKVAAAVELLKSETARLTSGEDWVRFLDLQSRLHCYSPRNSMLIAAQHSLAFEEGRVATSEPGVVAGYRTWMALGRQVERGQHGYAILAPVQSLHRIAVGPDDRHRRLHTGENLRPDETEERRLALRGFKVEYVFEVSMTCGEPLPNPPRPQILEGEAPPGLGLAVMELIEMSGFEVGKVSDAASIGGANGVTDWDNRTVMVRGDMDDAAMVKTLAHEAGHVLLHEHPPGRLLPRAVKEVEAESVAYVVASAHGMATGDYSFPYVAHWAGGGDVVTSIQASQDRIASAVRQIIAVSPASRMAGGRPTWLDLETAASRRRAAASSLADPTTAGRSRGISL